MTTRQTVLHFVSPNPTGRFVFYLTFTVSVREYPLPYDLAVHPGVSAQHAVTWSGAVKGRHTHLWRAFANCSVSVCFPGGKVIVASVCALP